MRYMRCAACFQVVAVELEVGDARNFYAFEWHFSRKTAEILPAPDAPQHCDKQPYDIVEVARPVRSARARNFSANASM